MLKNIVGVAGLLSFFFISVPNGQASNSDLRSVFQATEKLMDNEVDQFFGTFNQAELLDYMKKYGDRAGVARLSEKLSLRNSKEKEVGRYTFVERQVSKAEIFLGQIEKANHRVEKALAYAPTLWFSHGNDRPFKSYIDLMGLYLETGGKMSGLTQSKDFLNKVAKGYRDDGWRFQLYQNLGRMWAKTGHIKNARKDFQKAIDVALTFPADEGKHNTRMNHLLSIAGFQGQAGLYDDMAHTISLIETKDGESLNAAWKTIKATLDLRDK